MLGLFFKRRRQLLTINKVGERVPNATKEQSADEVFKRQERIVDTKEHGGQLEVDEENYNAQVN